MANRVRNLLFPLAQCSLVLAVALASASSLAAIQIHSFTVSGNNGETGSGFFTYDDQTVLNGDPVADGGPSGTGDMLSLELTILGGNIVGGQTVFTLSDCSDAYARFAPDFVDELNFSCNNGSNDVFGFQPFTADLNCVGGCGDTVTFLPGTTYPALSQATLVAAANPTSIDVGETSTLTTTGGSGTGTVSYSVVSGPCSLSDSTLTGTGAGTCSVTATKAADSTHAAATSAAIDITVTPQIQPSIPVPALPMGGLVILAGLAGLFGARKLRKAA